VGDLFGWAIKSAGSVYANVRKFKTATKIRWYTPDGQCVWVPIDLLDPADATFQEHVKNLDLPFSIVQVIAIQSESREAPDRICLEIKSNFCKGFSFKQEYSMKELEEELMRTKDFKSLTHLLKSKAFVEGGKAKWGSLSSDQLTRRATDSTALLAVMALENVEAPVLEQRLVPVVQDEMDDAGGERVVVLASTSNDGRKLPKIPSSARIVALVSHVQDGRLQLSNDDLRGWLKTHTEQSLVVVLICCHLLEKERVRIAKVFSQCGHWIAITHGEPVFYFLEEDVVVPCFARFLGAVGRHALDQEHRALSVLDPVAGTEHGVCTAPGPKLVLPPEKLMELASIHLAPMLKVGASGLKGGLQKVSLAFPYGDGKLLPLVGAPAGSVPLAASFSAAAVAVSWGAAAAPSVAGNGDLEQGDVDMDIADPVPQVAPQPVAAANAEDAIDLTMEDSVVVPFGFGGPGPVARSSYGPLRRVVPAAVPQRAPGTQLHDLVHLPDGLPESIFGRWGETVGKNVRKYAQFMDIFEGTVNGGSCYICFYYTGRIGNPDMRAITKNGSAYMTKKAGASKIKPLTRDDARAMLALLPPEAKATFEKNCTKNVHGFGAYKFNVKNAM